jgi:drug/metabolite transporter (DMT)-like permease
MLTSAAVLLVPLCFIVEAPLKTSPSILSVVALLINAVVATALGFMIYFRLIRTMGSMAASSAGYLKPAVGVLVGWSVFGEPFTFVMAVGLAAIILGVAIMNGRPTPSPYFPSGNKKRNTVDEPVL